MAIIWRRPGMAAIVMVTAEQPSGQCQAMLDYDDTHRGTRTIIYPRDLCLFSSCWLLSQLQLGCRNEWQMKNKSTHAHNLFCTTSVWASTSELFSKVSNNTMKQRERLNKGVSCYTSSLS